MPIPLKELIDKLPSDTADRSIEGHRLLHAIDESPAAAVARQRYASYYSLSRIRDMASRMKGSRHGDLWRQFQLVSNALSGMEAYAAIREQLALPALGSFLWSPTSTTALNSAEITNHDFLDALRNLAFTRQGSALRPVDYKNLGAEELGGVYESLLALTPQISADGARFTFAEFAGNERKTSGSYYTPEPLVQCLLDSALDPVVEQAIRGKSPADAEKAILALKVCDPAVGSGHFLVGAAHRLARHLALQRSLAQGESEPSPLHYQHALRDVIGRCLYGVDINPMSAELCRVSLWLEALDPGKPLSFLDHHIQVGNSLLGTTPALLAKGIPDEAFTPIEGDDKEVCARFKRVNRDERQGQQHLFAPTTEPWERLSDLAASMAQIDVAPDDSLESVEKKQRLYEEMVHSGNYLNGRFWADAWCAAFVWKKTSEFKYPITEEVFRRIEHNPHGVDAWMRDEIMRLAKQYQFFHWHLAFPDVFRNLRRDPAADASLTGREGGFDVVLGNPPWEVLEDEELKFFAISRPDIAEAETAKRKRLIDSLASTDPVLHQEWLSFRDERSRFKHFHRASGRFPLASYKKLNLYATMLENAIHIISSDGFLGMIVQSGLATDESRKFLFQYLFSSKKLRSLFDFENTELLFRDVHAQQKFSLVTASQQPADSPAKFSFYNTRIEHLNQEDRTFYLSPDDVAKLSPNTGACPTFRNLRDSQLVLRIYEVAPAFSDDTKPIDWVLEFSQMFNSSSNNGLFKITADLMDRRSGIALCRQFREQGWLQVYEGKFLDQFNHRLATFEDCSFDEMNRGAERHMRLSELEDANQVTLPRWWVPRSAVEQRVSRPIFERGWFFGFCDIANPQNARTACSAFMPVSGVSDTVWLLLGKETTANVATLCSMVNSFVLDFVARRRIGSRHLKQFVFKQLPFLQKHQIESVCRWDQQEVLNLWILHRVLELSVTGWDLRPLASDAGKDGPPFLWNEERRFYLRCELDAALFHEYLGTGAEGEWIEKRGLFSKDIAILKEGFHSGREAVDYVMETFPIVKRSDEEIWGEYRTKRVILEIYDAMAEAMRTGVPYQSRLNPPPADPSCRHPKKKIGILAYGSLISDPGSELEPKIQMRIKTQTPFPVEYGRISRTRGGAPTLVPHDAGAPVTAEILVLDDDVSIEEARNMLWRRETRQEGSDRTYSAGTSENSVLVQTIDDDPCVETVLYTDFNPAGKLPHPTAADLAKAAIESVAKADPGKDGISYLIAALESGIRTPLTDEYRAEILRQSGAGTLQELLQPASSLQ